ncbi:MAG TPA: endolytic transglycosylase MltG [Candidatus Kapabacteria bacterium]|nr:endolytic transglycosylase MltG [Candidatus Kapabacteria bacterium]
MKKKSILFLFIILLILGAGIYTAYDAIYGENTLESERITIIPPNSSATVIADSLAHAGIIRNKYSFMIALKLLDKESQLHPGIYEFKPHETNKDIIFDLSHVRNAQHYFATFPEGITSFAIAHIAHEQLNIDSARFVHLVHDSAFVHSLGIDAVSLEGYLFPDTYEFDPPVTEKAVAARMVYAFRHFFTDSLMHRCNVLGMTQEQILTLASIVEGEAAEDTERARIAGVYWNRLHDSMKLEADPTIQYILGSPRRLSYDDLRIESPYNTYIHPGLPPTPINNPGRASILAALYPEKNDYIYFVARGDGSRMHRFSRTIEEHEKAVEMYRRERNKSAISSKGG